MKAAVLTDFGPPEVLHVREVVAPVAKDSHDLLIRVRATSVNFGDTLVRNFAAVSPRAFHMPWLFWLVGKLAFGFSRPRIHILGSEFAGTVEAVGERVTRFNKGDPVFGYCGSRMGAYAEYLPMPENGVVTTKPANMTDEEAAGCPYGALMAFGLLTKIRLQPGQQVLVVGASGGIGSAIVQLAKHHFGATVVGVCGTARQAYVKSLGADSVIDYTQQNFVDRPDTYDLVIDILGKSSFGRCRGSLPAPRSPPSRRRSSTSTASEVRSSTASPPSSASVSAVSARGCSSPSRRHRSTWCVRCFSSCRCCWRRWC